jgi:hypothetical protein
MQAILDVRREPKAYSTLSTGADMGSGCSWKRTEEEATKEVSSPKRTNNTGVTEGREEA